MLALALLRFFSDFCLFWIASRVCLLDVYSTALHWMSRWSTSIPQLQMLRLCMNFVEAGDARIA